LWLKVTYKFCYWIEQKGTLGTKILKKSPRISISKSLKLSPKPVLPNRNKNLTAFIPNSITLRPQNKPQIKSSFMAIRNLLAKMSLSTMSRLCSRP
jgi:hypothetical protein